MSSPFALSCPVQMKTSPGMSLCQCEAQGTQASCLQTKTDNPTGVRRIRKFWKKTSLDHRDPDALLGLDSQPEVITDTHETQVLVRGESSGILVDTMS